MPETLHAYQRDAYARRLDADLVSTGVDGQGRPWAVFADTVFYPEGGGQPGDRGRVGGALVLDTQKSAEGPRHFLATPLAPGRHTLEVDWPRRFDLMQQHTGQHLLSALALREFGWNTTAFHLQDHSADVELDVASPTAEQLEALEEAMAAAVRAALPVRGCWVQPEAMAGLGVRSRGLPADHRGEVRLVEIQGIDLNTCGGTHVASTAELEMVKLLGTEKVRGGTRVYFAVGGRLRRRVGKDLALLAELNKAFSSNDDSLLPTALGRLEQKSEADRQLRRLEGRLADAVVAALLASPDTVVDWHDDDASPALIQQIARRYAAAPEAALLFATGNGQFALAAGPRAPQKADAAGRQVAEILGAKGGGNTTLFQGRAPSLEARAAAVASLRG